MSIPTVLCLVGATGSGKTAAALRLAHCLNGEVVNADSRQVYADFPCITAQPTAEEQAQCPHHLYGFLPTEAKISAGQWVAKAMDKVRELTDRGKMPILVGGTGLYFKALLEGIAEIPPVDPAISARWSAECEALGPVLLHKGLQQCDPAYAARIHPHDKQRIVRALEVWESSGHTFSWWHEHAMPEPLCRGLRVGIQWSLADLTPRLVQRIELMLAAGAVEEARAALQHCPNPAAPGWTGIGCVELLHYVQGARSMEESCALWAANTRAYAKRQITWFRADTHIRWFGPQELDALCAYAQENVFPSTCQTPCQTTCQEQHEA